MFEVERQLTVDSLAQMELNKLVAAFFRRFDAKVDPVMRPQDMRLFDSFSAGPAGRKLILQIKEAVDHL